MSYYKLISKSSVEKIEIGSEKDENNEEIEKIKNKISFLQVI